MDSFPHLGLRAEAHKRMAEVTAEFARTGTVLDVESLQQSASVSWRVADKFLREFESRRVQSLGFDLQVLLARTSDGLYQEQPLQLLPAGISLTVTVPPFALQEERQFEATLISEHLSNAGRQMFWISVIGTTLEFEKRELVPKSWCVIRD